MNVKRDDYFTLKEMMRLCPKKTFFKVGVIVHYKCNSITVSCQINLDHLKLNRSLPERTSQSSMTYIMDIQAWHVKHGILKDYLSK